MFSEKIWLPLALTLFAFNTSAQQSDGKNPIVAARDGNEFVLNAVSSQDLVAAIKQGQENDKAMKRLGTADGDAVSLTQSFPEQIENNHRAYRAVLLCEEPLTVGDPPKCHVQAGIQSPEDYQAICGGVPKGLYGAAAGLKSQIKSGAGADSRSSH